MIIIADTSAMFAAFDRAQPEHRSAAKVMQEEIMAISPLVLTELDHLIHRDIGFEAAMAVSAALNERIADGQYKLADLKPADLRTAHDQRAKYKGLRLDLADAVGIVLADRYRTNCIFTLDERDFRAIKPLTAGYAAFRLLPADTD